MLVGKGKGKEMPGQRAKVEVRCGWMNGRARCKGEGRERNIDENKIIK